MYKLAKWLWRKSERTTAQTILDMMRAYYVPPLQPKEPSHEEAIEYKKQMACLADGFRMMEIITNHFFPEIRKNEIKEQAKRDLEFAEAEIRRPRP